MKRRMLALLASCFLAYNLALVITTVALSNRSEARFGPAGSFIEVDDLRLHYLDSGPTGTQANDELPVLVLLHGASTSLLDFQPSLRPALERHYRIIAFDRPGHGHSERDSKFWPDPSEQARLIANALRRLNVSGAVWVGHSWSGSVVLAGLLDQPNSAAAGVLIAGTSHPWQRESAWHLKLSATPVLGHIFVWQYVQPAGQLLLDTAVAGVFNPEPVPQNYVETTGVTLSLRPTAYRNNALDVTRLSNFLNVQKDRYATITQPLLLITGSSDDVVPAWNHSARLVKQVAKTTWVEIDGAGHALHHTRTKRVTLLIDEFASTVRR